MRKNPSSQVLGTCDVRWVEGSGVGAALEAVRSRASLCLGEAEVLLILSERGGGWDLVVHDDLASGLGHNYQWPRFTSFHHSLELPCLGLVSGRLCPKGGPHGLAMRARSVPDANGHLCSWSSHSSLRTISPAGADRC